MATIKHIASKNADYGAAEKYLLYEHDEFSMKPVLEKGYLVPREDYRIGAVLTTPDRFAADCMAANLRYGKNMSRGDIKSHHYIISFDPRDGPDHGLTVDRAQELGMKFCKEHFPGHQALVCTHPDGHNHSGNIHVHIVINSLRVSDVPFMPYMDRACDTKAGMKHRCTGKALRYLSSEVMEMCQAEGLYQIDLLNGSDERVNDREYWAKKKGQMKLDKANVQNDIPGGENAPAETGKTKPTKFETEKEKLRNQIRAVLEETSDFENFQAQLMQKFGVTVKESRGRFSYLTPDRTKPVTARRLGDAFEKAAVLAKLEENRFFREEQKPAKQRDAVLEDGVLVSGKNPSKTIIPEKNVFAADKGRTGSHPGRSPQEKRSAAPVGRLVDVEEKMAVSPAYGKWAKLYNLQTAAKCLVYLEEHGFPTPEALDTAYEKAGSEARAAQQAGEETAAAIRAQKVLLGYLGDYWGTKKQRAGYQRSINKKAYRKSYPEELKRSDAAVEYFEKKKISLKNLPKIADVQAKIEKLISRKNRYYQTFEEKDRERSELKEIREGVDKILLEAGGNKTETPRKTVEERTDAYGSRGYALAGQQPAMPEKPKRTSDYYGDSDRREADTRPKPPSDRRSIHDRLREAQKVVDGREVARKGNQSQRRSRSGDLDL